MLPPADAKGAHPFFLLDSWRLAYRFDSSEEGVFDNRYMLDTMARFPGVFSGVAIVDERPAPGIDTEHDLEQANTHWAGFHSGLD